MGVYLCWRARSWLPVCPLPFLPRLRETGRAHQQAIAGRDDIQILTELARLDVSTQDHASSRLMTAEECGPFLASTTGLTYGSGDRYARCLE
jgi:hypothetical protein